MDPEVKKLLEETSVLVQENNKILLSIKRSMRISSIMTAVYWIFIIGSAVGAFYYIQPYLQDIYSAYGGVGDALSNFK